jgi:hypothetical protein
MQEEEQEQGFHVRDRRIRHEDDEPAAEESPAAPEDKTEATAEAAPDTASETASEGPGASAERPEPASKADAGRSDADAEAEAEAALHREAEQGFSMAAEGPPIDFSAFVFSLAHNALIHLGLEPHPETGRQQPHLEAARETIDVLGMLEAKTRGNLTPEESELISKMLYTLRMSFVEVSRAVRPAE